MITYYCSPDGTGDGLTAQTPCTVFQAKTLAQSTAHLDNICIWMMGGAYKLTEPLQFTSADSGKNGNYIFWRAYPGEKPYFSGEGESIVGWALFNSQKNIWRTNIGGGKRFSVFFVNGEKAQRAKRVFSSQAEKGIDDNSRTISYQDYSGNSIGSVARPQDLEIFGYPHPWQVGKFKVSSFSTHTDGDIYTLFTESELGSEYGAYELEETVNAIGGSLPYVMYWVENALEFLNTNTPGQYYYNKDDGWLYYVPRLGEDMSLAHCQIPILDTIIMSPENSNFENVYFIGIGVKYNDWSEHLDKYYWQTDVGCEFDDWRLYTIDTDDGNVTTIPKAAVEFNHSKNIHWIQAELSQLNSNGIHFKKGCIDCSFEGGLLTKTGMTPIRIGIKVPGYYPQHSLQFFDYLDIPEVDRTKNTKIFNNKIFGDEITTWESLTAVFSDSAEQTKLIHNDVSSLTYCGLVISPRTGNYVDYYWDHEISYNKIHDVMLTRRDGGGIYVGRTNTIGLKIHNNFLFNIANYPNGALTYWEAHPLYCDDDSIGITVEKNVVLKNRVAGPKTWALFKYQTSSWSDGWQTVPGLDEQHPMILRDNYYSSGLIRAEFVGHDTSGAKIIENNLAINESNPTSWPSAVQGIIDKAGLVLLCNTEIIDGQSIIYGWGENVQVSTTDGTIEHFEESDGMWRATVAGLEDGAIVTAQTAGKIEHLTIGTISGNIIVKDSLKLALKGKDGIILPFTIKLN